MIHFLEALDSSELTQIEAMLWPSKQINQIVAISKNYVIGKDGVLPWSIDEDWEIFLKKTKNGVLIMGRLSFQEMIKDSDWDNSRIYVVLSRQHPKVSYPNVHHASSLKEALMKAEGFGKTIWICGGESIYKDSLNLSGAIHLTRINRRYDGDTFFPMFEESHYLCHSKIDSNFKDLKYTFEIWTQEK